MPGPTTTSESRLTRLQHRLADREAERQLRWAGRVGVDRRRGRGASALLAALLALGVNLATVGVVVGGLLVLWQAHWLFKPFGVLLLLIAAAVLPRLRLPDAEVVLSRDDAPHLFGLIDRVAACGGAPVPTQVRLDASFNAWATGLRRRTVGLGVPLWMAASPQARVALLAHELGHLAHGDLLDSWWAGRAAVSLDRWTWLVDDRQDEGWEWLAGEGGSMAQSVLSIVYAPLRSVFLSLQRSLLVLDAAASRRREHLADLDAIAAAGSDGARDLLQTALVDELVSAALTRAALGPRRAEPWTVVADALAAVDARGRANRVRLAEQSRSRVDDTHPLTATRLRLVDSRPATSAAVVVDTGEAARLDAELAPYVDLVGQRVVEMIRYTT